MNRSKHMNRPGFARKNPGADRTKNTTGYRITASWDERPDRPAIRHTSDKAKARRMAREYAGQGAYVLIEEHTGWGEYRTRDEINGPALVAEASAVEQLAAAGWPQPPANFAADEPDRCRRWLAWMLAKADAAQAATDARNRFATQLARVSRELMTPPAEVRTDRRARHITGAQR